MKNIFKFIIGVLIAINFQSVMAISLSLNSNSYRIARLTLLAKTAHWIGITDLANCYIYNSRKTLLQKLHNKRASQYSSNIDGYFSKAKSNRYSIHIVLNSYILSLIKTQVIKWSQHEIDKLYGFAYKLENLIEREKDVFEKHQKDISKQGKKKQAQQLEDAKDVIKNDSQEGKGEEFNEKNKNSILTTTNEKDEKIGFTII